METIVEKIDKCTTTKQMTDVLSEEVYELMAGMIAINDKLKKQPDKDKELQHLLSIAKIMGVLRSSINGLQSILNEGEKRNGR